LRIGLYLRQAHKIPIPQVPLQTSILKNIKLMRTFSFLIACLPDHLGGDTESDEHRGHFTPGSDSHIGLSDKKETDFKMKPLPLSFANKSAYFYLLVYPGPDFPLCSSAIRMLLPWISGQRIL